MKKILRFFFLAALVVSFCCGAPAAGQAAFPERPVSFAVLDHSGAVDGSVYSQWRSVVKWAYHFPYYKIKEDGAAQKAASEAVAASKKVTADTMAKIAAAAESDVVVLARIYDMSENMIYSIGFDDGPYVRVCCRADLFVYRVKDGKFLTKKLREDRVRDLGNYDKPQETVKWALSKLVNTMEGRPIIGEE